MPGHDHILTNVNRIDALFKESDPGNYFLSVQLGEQIFSYCILDGKTNKYLGIGEFKQPAKSHEPETSDRIAIFDLFLSKVISATPLLKQRFKDSKITWEGSKYTLVPESLMQKERADRYLSLNVPFNPAEEVILLDHVKHLKAYTIFSIPLRIRSIIQKHLHTDQISHISSALIEGILINYKNQMLHPKCFLHIRESFFDLIIADHEKLYYSNSFDFKTPEDLVYYVIFVLDQLGFSPDEAEVILMGKIQKNAPLYQILFKYIRKLEFAPRNPSYSYSFVFNNLPPHYYFPLLNLNLCGL